MSHAVLFVAHGSRSAEANRFLERRVGEVAGMLPGAGVAVGFLRAGSPDPGEAFDVLVGAGARRVAVVPLFLAPGGHVTRDLPALVRALERRHPGVAVELTAALGEAGAVWGAAAGLALAALRPGRAPGIPPCGEPTMERRDYDLRPLEIERKSFEIIEGLVDLTGLDPAEAAVVKRVVHTTGDPGFANLLRWSPGAVGAGVRALASGAPVVTDVQMARAGISRVRAERFGVEVRCWISDPEIREEARARGVTRSIAAVERAVAEHPEAVFAFGNAPTALFRLLELVDEGRARPRLVIGVVVGFVGAAESKEALMARADVPWIACRGNRGGSAVAAATVNALLKAAAGEV